MRRSAPAKIRRRRRHRHFPHRRFAEGSAQAREARREEALVATRRCGSLTKATWATARAAPRSAARARRILAKARDMANARGIRIRNTSVRRASRSSNAEKPYPTIHDRKRYPSFESMTARNCGGVKTLKAGCLVRNALPSALDSFMRSSKSLSFETINNEFVARARST